MLSLLLTFALTFQMETEIATTTPSEAVRILIVVRGSEALPNSLPVLMREVQRIWSPARVQLEWATTLGADVSAVERIITLYLSDELPALTLMPATALGAVPMVHGRMLPVIYVSTKAVKRLLSSASVPESIAWFPPLYARTIGRVVAHELGHLLTRSTTHRPSGLMRASFVPRDVLSTDASRYEIFTDGAARLR